MTFKIWYLLGFYHFYGAKYFKRQKTTQQRAEENSMSMALGTRKLGEELDGIGRKMMSLLFVMDLQFGLSWKPVVPKEQVLQPFER